MSPRLVPLIRLAGLSALCAVLSLGCGGGSNPPQPPPANPQPDAAASTVSVERSAQVVADGVDRVGITITVKQQNGAPMQGRTVRVDVSGEGNTVTQPAGTTDANGVAVAFLVSTRAGAKQVTATVENTAGAVVLNARPTVTFIAPPATRLVFSGAALSATAGVPMGGLEVALQDVLGNTVTAATNEVTLSLAAGPGGATAEGTLTARAVAGVARFPEVVLKQAGAGYQWKADAAGLEGATSVAFTVAPAAAASVELSGLVATTTAGAAQPAMVTLRDAFGNVATGYTGTLTVTSSDLAATLPAPHTFTAEDAGRFTFTGITLRRAGSQRVTILDTLAPALTAGQDVAVTAAEPAALSFLTVPASGSVRTVLGPVQVLVEDAFGNQTSANAPAVSLSLVQGALGGVTEVAPFEGRATFTQLRIDAEGAFQLRATAPGLTGATSATSIDIVDDVAPAQPSLQPGSSNARSVTVTWTAVGDDRDEGTAASQELRYSTAPITSDAEFEAATPVQGLGAPAPAGTSESFTLTSLQPSRTYHVALRVTDNHNQSSRSASLAVQTQNAAVAALSFSTQPADGTAGQPLETVRVSLLDDHGDVVTTATSPVTLRLVGTAPFEPVTVEAAAGVATFTGLRVDRAGQWGFRAHVGDLMSDESRRFTIAPGAAARLTLTGLVAPVVAGASGSVEVTAHDAFDNVATGYTGTVHFTSSDTEADLPGDFIFTAQDAGRHVFSGVALYTAGTQRVSVTDTADAALTARFDVDVTSDAVARLELEGLPAEVTAGAARDFTVTARDRFGNIATGYSGTVHFESSDARAALPGVYTFTAADAGRHQFSVTMGAAGAQTVTVVDDGNAALTATANTRVVAGAASRLTLFVHSSTVAAGAPVSATVTVVDAYGNEATGYRGTVGLSVNDPDATLPANHTFTEADAGRHTFSVSFTRLGTVFLNAEDTANPGLVDREGVQVLPGALAELRVMVFSNTTVAGSYHAFEVIAYDRFGNQKTDYTGTVRPASSDPRASPLDERTYRPEQQGSYGFTIRFETAGAQWATFTDSVAGVTGRSEFTVEAAAPSQLVLLASPATGTVRAPLAQTRVALRDAFGNTAPVSAPAVTITAMGRPAGAVLSGTRTVDPVDGVAVFDGLSVDMEGLYRFLVDTSEPGIDIAEFDVEVSDTVAPAAARLEAALSDGRIQLSWRATGDDGELGRAARYELRIHSEPITEDNFGEASRLPTVDPREPGEQETADAGNLAPGQTYYFGLRVIDGAGNASALAVASASIPGVCDGHVCPERAPVCTRDGVGIERYEGSCVDQDGEPTCEYRPFLERCPGESGVCFQGACAEATQPGPAEVVISEVMHTPDDGTTEYIELTNTTDRLLNIHGLVVFYDDGTTDYGFDVNRGPGGAVVMGPRSTFVVAQNADRATNGGVPVDFEYGNSLPLGSSGQLTLYREGRLESPVDELTYNFEFPQETGRSMNLASLVVGTQSSRYPWYWCDSVTSILEGTARGTPGLPNETCGVAITSPVDYCAIQSPKTIPDAIPMNTPQFIYSRFRESEVTNRNLLGNDYFPYIEAELGYGTDASAPAGWTWGPTFFNFGYTTGADFFDDEVYGTFSIPTPGSYVYGFRYRFTRGPTEAQQWVYCDQNGPVTASGSPNFGTVTVDPPLPPPGANHVVISEISGRDVALLDDFIELYNPTGQDIPIGGWLVQYKSSTGTAYSGTVTIPANTVIRAHGYYLLAHQSGYTGAATPDLRFSFDMSGSPAAGGHVRIGPGLTSSPSDVAVDKLGWGTANSPEGTAGPAHPAAGGSLERKALATSTAANMEGGIHALRGNGRDSDNNAEDFIQRITRQPQNSLSPTEQP